MTQPSPFDPKNDRPDSLANYFKNHYRDTIAYILLVLGIVLLFFAPVYGGVIVGLVAGIYFGDEVVDFITNWKMTINSYGMAKNLILTGLILAFLISAPAIFLGIAIAVAIKQLFMAQSK